MGSIGNERPTKGTFQIPVFEPGYDDPWKRPYMLPPKMTKTVSRTYGLVDFREDVFGTGDHTLSPTSPSGKFLTKHGFTAVKHKSALLGPSFTRDDLDKVQMMDEIYYPEITDLVKKLTGCKSVFIEHSFIRGPHRENVDTGDSSRRYDRETVKGVDLEKPTHKVVPSPCIRIPHDDSTTLGGRRMIRNSSQRIYNAAVEAGIIAAEDEICERAGVKATDKESNIVLGEHYNAGGVAGPRYATFSIWRPLKRVTRDPLAMAPRAQFKAPSECDIVAWDYDNRNAGHWGDWLRELVMLRVQEGAKTENEAVAIDVDLASNPRSFPPDNHTSGESETETGPVKFYYCSEMEAEEVLVVKLMDSASVGEDAPEADGPLHGSPSLGDFGYGDARESLEVRLIAIW